ncbi:hypothetical protein [Leptospira kanakyensis]|uniref:hypothetical protein n=1 Tax=Leptospira kanakyensis TaxID=2484968 RepID=UPI00223E61DA|nr:hypothetical protein [Leptospira kanakyensis]MCW7481275.1 hypothetical protein [Leptospira kanakyensis]
MKVVKEWNGRVYFAGDFTKVGVPVGGGSFVNLDTGTIFPTEEFMNFNDLGAVRVTSAVLDGVGGIFVSGHFQIANTKTRTYLAHFLSDGKLDPNFNVVINGVVNKVTVHAGVLYLLGDFTAVNGNTRNYLAAVDLTSGQVNSWNPNPDVQPNDIVIGEGVAFVVGGYFSSLGGQLRQFAGAVDLVTGIATSWQPSISGASIKTVSLSGGIVYIGGNFTSINGNTRNNLGAINASDGLDTSWNPNVDGEVTKLLIRDGKAYFGGSFTLVGGSTPRNFLARVSLSGAGSPDTWAPAISSFSLNPLEDVYETNDSVFFVGNFDSVNGQSRASAVKVDSTFGTVTDSWNPGLYNNGSNFSTKSILPWNNRLFIGGNYIFTNIVDRNYLFSADLNHQSITNFTPNFNGLINDITFHGNYLYASGNFTQVGSSTRNGFVELDFGTAQPSNWNPAFGASAGEIQTLAVKDDALYVGGDFTTVDASSINRLAKIDLSGTSRSLLWPNLNFNGSVRKLVFSETELFVSGTFTTVSGNTRAGMVCLNLPGATVTNFTANFADPITTPNNNPIGITTGLGTIKTIHIFGGAIYFAGEFSSVNGQSRYLLAGFDLEQKELLPFTMTVPGSSVYGLSDDGNSLYLLSLSQYDLNLYFQTALAKIDKTGGVDRNFSQLQSGNLSSFSMIGGVPIVVGSFYKWNQAFTQGIWVVQ